MMLKGCLNHFEMYYASVILYDGICDETKTLDTLPLLDWYPSGTMPKDENWVISSSGRHMLVRLRVGDEFSSPGFLAKIHYGNEINDIKIVNQQNMHT